MKYEYCLLEDTDVAMYDIEDINKLGQEGWRLVWTQVTEKGEKSLFERTEL